VIKTNHSSIIFQDERCQKTAVGSSWAGIIVSQEGFINLQIYKWELVRQIDYNRSWLNLKVESNQGENTIQYQMEDSEFAKYTTKLFLGRKNFYADNASATKRQSNNNETFRIEEGLLERRPTLRKDQKPVIRDPGVPEINNRKSTENLMNPNSINNSSASLDSVPGYRNCKNIHFN
jgi:hypothetical protein